MLDPDYLEALAETIAEEAARDEAFARGAALIASMCLERGIPLPPLMRKFVMTGLSDFAMGKTGALSIRTRLGRPPKTPSIGLEIAELIVSGKDPQEAIRAIEEKYADLDESTIRKAASREEESTVHLVQRLAQRFLAIQNRKKDAE